MILNVLIVVLCSKMMKKINHHLQAGEAQAGEAQAEEVLREVLREAQVVKDHQGEAPQKPLLELHHHEARLRVLEEEVGHLVADHLAKNQALVDPLGVPHLEGQRVDLHKVHNEAHLDE